MTDNTMREGKLWAFLHDSIHEAYKKLSTTGTSTEYHALLDSIASKVADDVDARFLQAAQSVPVVGEPWRYVVNKSDGTPLLSVCSKEEADKYRAREGLVVFPVFREPTHSIPAADIELIIGGAENNADPAGLHEAIARVRSVIAGERK